MRNITIKEYAALKDKSKYIFLESLKPKNSFSSYVVEVENMSYDEVKGVLRTLRNFNTFNDAKDIFETCFKIDSDTFWIGSIVDYFQAKNYIVETFKNILKTENKLLQSISKDSILWKSAGGDRLNRFSDIIPLNQLGKIYGMYPFELKDFKYYEILSLLTLEKERGEIEQEFNKLKHG